jgi:hypothetical protein
LTVQLFINHLEGQAPGPLPPEAWPLRLPNREPELREWQAIEHIFREGLFAGADHTALLSPMFPAKTGISFGEVASFVVNNPGYDVYLFDAGAHYRYYTFNVREWFDIVIPGYGTKFIECFAQIGETIEFATLVRSLPGNSVNANAWVGNARFWRAVIGDAVRLIATLRARPVVWRSLCEPVITNGTIYPFLPLVLENFVPHWLTTRPGMAVKAWPYDRDYVLARCKRSLERPFISGFYDLINDWDAAGDWGPDRRAFLRDIAQAILRQWRSSNECMVYPWTGKRIGPAR